MFVTKKNEPGHLHISLHIPFCDYTVQEIDTEPKYFVVVYMDSGY